MTSIAKIFFILDNFILEEKCNALTIYVSVCFCNIFHMSNKYKLLLEQNPCYLIEKSKSLRTEKCFNYFPLLKFC